MYFSIPFSFISMPFISKSTLLCLFFVVTLPSVLNKVKDMMWLLLAFLSAALLGFYDVFKKQSLKDNAVIPVLFLNTLFSSLIFLPFIVLSVWRPGILENSIFYVPVAGWEVHRYVVLKSVIVLSSWMLGYFGMKNLPITIVGPINATRPVMVLVGAVPTSAHGEAEGRRFHNVPAVLLPGSILAINITLPATFAHTLTPVPRIPRYGHMNHTSVSSKTRIPGQILIRTTSVCNSPAPNRPAAANDRSRNNNNPKNRGFVTRLFPPRPLTRIAANRVSCHSPKKIGPTTSVPPSP